MNAWIAFKRIGIRALYDAGLLQHFWKGELCCETRFGKMYLHPRDGMSAWLRRMDCFEPEVVEFVQKNVRVGDRVLDIGSAWGEYAIQFNQLVGKSGKVASIEPFPKYFELLKKTWNANPNYQNRWGLWNVGVSKKKGKIFFPNNATLYEGLGKLNEIDYAKNDTQNGNPNNGFSVESVPLKELISRIGFQPTLLFMDIEGGELQVFDQLIALNIKPRIIFESHETFYGKEKLQDWLKKLESYGYSVQSIDATHYYLH